jgi:hypothetical protein
MIKIIMTSKSKDSLFHELETPEGTIFIWMKEDKLCSSVDSLEDDRNAKEED